MRIISQNGCDFPYEQIAVIIDESSIVCRSVSNANGKIWTLGDYSSEERAQEVSNEIHDNCAPFDTSAMVFVMPEE